MARDKKQPTDPNKLVRQAAGTYRTADQRFEVRGGGSHWFLVDSQSTDDLGQELVRGPLPTLNAVREAIPEARREDLKPLPPAPRSGKPAKPKPKPKAKPAAQPSWIDGLPKAEAADVRGLIRALEREGVAKAEQLVRRDREGLEPAVAGHLLERRLAQLVDEFPDEGRDGVRALVARVVTVLSDAGSSPSKPLPGWVLLEIGREPEPQTDGSGCPSNCAA
ncbi:hypothetical protein BH23CHL6_BH23CHL6_10530 [soil metagenome]